MLFFEKKSHSHEFVRKVMPYWRLIWRYASAWDTDHELEDHLSVIAYHLQALIQISCLILPVTDVLFY